MNKELDNNRIVGALSEVRDPQSGLSLIDQKRIRDLRIEGNRVMFSLHVTGLDDEVKSGVNFACMEAIQKVYPDADVHVHMVHDQTGGESRQVLPQVKNIIAVASGKGGVGKSTVAVNLALALKELGYTTGILDADLYGPSIPTLLDLHGTRPKVQEVYGKHKIVPVDARGLKVMSIGFVVEPEQAVVLRGPRLAGILKQFIQDCMWPELDFLVIDLPPGTGDIQLTLVQTVPVTGALIVTTPQEMSFADALKAMNMFRLSNINVPILGVVENMSWFTPAELPDNKYYLFGQGGGARLAAEGNTEVLIQIPLVQSIQEQSDIGRPTMSDENDSSRAYFIELAENLIKKVKMRLDKLAPTEVVRVSKD